ncbi:hypothetical protein KY347_05125 [Candidatus Woesearchaeota archaeon]|nr:hypothetical protein [Candidatus Woesearchaeota archaeon]
MHTYRKKTITVLFSLLIVFLLIFTFSYIQLKRKIAVFSIGLPYYTENMLVLVLSAVSVLRVVYEIYRVEHPYIYERRLKKAM